jgi:hypothetical protein
MELENEIVELVKRETGLNTISLNTNIASEECGIFDLDAENLMMYFFKKYNINYSNFIIDKYFIYPNYSWKSLIFIRCFFKKPIYPKKPPITIKHLIEVVKKGEWVDPPNWRE